MVSAIINPSDRDAYITLEKYFPSCILQVIKLLLTDVNSREIYFSGLTPVDSALLTFIDVK